MHIFGIEFSFIILFDFACSFITYAVQKRCQNNTLQEFFFSHLFRCLKIGESFNRNNMYVDYDSNS